MSRGERSVQQWSNFALLCQQICCVWGEGQSSFRVERVAAAGASARFHRQRLICVGRLAPVAIPNVCEPARVSCPRVLLWRLIAT